MATWELLHNGPTEARAVARQGRVERDAERAERESDPAEPSAERRPCSVLVVDGSAAAREAIAELLREYGHSVQTAGCIRELERVCAALAAPPDLAFLEFHLRDGRADQAAAQLRARWPSLFVLYFSCVPLEDDEALSSALLAPATAMLFKPTSLDAILEVMRKRPCRAAQSN